MSLYKEIVTKAIVGKGKKYFKDNYFIDASNKPDTILGAWVINHKFKGYESNNSYGVNGSYDVNIWYSYDNNSKTTVESKTITYNDSFNVKLKENTDLSSDTDIIVMPLKQPNCSKVDISDSKITFDIEKELGVEIVGETKVKISVEEDEEPWEEIEELTDKDIKEIDSVNSEFIK